MLFAATHRCCRFLIMLRKMMYIRLFLIFCAIIRTFSGSHINGITLKMIVQFVSSTP